MNGKTIAVGKGKLPRTRAGTGCQREPISQLVQWGWKQRTQPRRPASSGRGQQAKLGNFWSPNYNPSFLQSGPGPGERGSTGRTEETSGDASAPAERLGQGTAGRRRSAAAGSSFRT